jgi:hypothetical protein
MAFNKTGGFKPEATTTTTAKENAGFQAQVRPIQKGFQSSPISQTQERGFQSSVSPVPAATSPTSPSIPATGVSITTTASGSTSSEGSQGK